MLCVIAVHTNPKPLASNLLFTNALVCILLSCNGNFYMLSGQLNLKKEFHSKDDYWNFYIKRFISIVIPFFLMTCVLTVFNLVIGKESVTFPGLFKRIYSAFMADHAATYLWFIYPLLVMLLGAPFFTKMFHTMADWELNLLFGAAMCWSVFSIFLTRDLGIGFSYSGWFLADWMFAFFAGYYSDRIIKGANRWKWYAAGLTALVVNVLGMTYFPGNYLYPTDSAPTYMLFYIGVYSFLRNEMRVRNEGLAKLIRFLAKHSFSVYLVHWTVSTYLTPAVVDLPSAGLTFLGRVTVTFVVSLMLAFVFDTVILNPLQRVLKRRLVRTDS